MEQKHYNNNELIKNALVANAMPVPYAFRCKYSGNCNGKNVYFNPDWLLPYSDRMKGRLWRTTYRTEENCGQKLWFFIAILFIMSIMF